jgi:hypothetical protein
MAVQVKDLLTTLRVHITQKKPYKKGCKACQRYALESKSHSAITTSTVLKSGTHSFPFSFNVGNYLPPSMDNSLVAVIWELQTGANVQPHEQSPTIPRLYTYECDLHVVRAIRVPIPIESSRRIFPASGIELSCQYDPVMHKASANRVELTLSGLLSHPDNGETINVWKLLKGSWWVEENIKTTAKACGSHSHMPLGNEQHVKRDREQTNVLGRGDIYNGWMPNANADTIGFSFEYSLKKPKRNISFNSETGNKGEMVLSHSLVMELVLIREHYPKDGSASPTRTGIARILRSSHNLFLSDYTRTFIHNQDKECELPCYTEGAVVPPDYK